MFPSQDGRLGQAGSNTVLYQATDLVETHLSYETVARQPGVEVIVMLDGETHFRAHASLSSRSTTHWPLAGFRVLTGRLWRSPEGPSCPGHLTKLLRLNKAG